MTSFRLHDEQTVNGLRKIAWASVFRLIFLLKSQSSPIFYSNSMTPYVHDSMSMTPCPCLHIHVFPVHVSMSPHFHVSCLCLLFPCLHVSGIPQTENDNFCLFAANGKWEMANFSLYAANGNGKRKFVFLGGRIIYGNRRLLFQQTCPHMALRYRYMLKWK